MNVSLTPELERFIGEQLKTGLYRTASEVVREGLRLLKEREEDRHHQLQALRRDIATGISQAARGRTRPLDKTTFARVRAAGAKALARGAGNDRKRRAG
jgi:antitoxin ParD1/3/4